MASTFTTVSSAITSTTFATVNVTNDEINQFYFYEVSDEILFSFHKICLFLFPLIYLCSTSHLLTQTRTYPMLT
jgi:hypothetical protein